MVCLKQTRVLLTHGGLIMSRIFGIFYVEVSGETIEYEGNSDGPSGEIYGVTRRTGNVANEKDIDQAICIDMESREDMLNWNR